MILPQESNITVNGVQLTEGQAMTVRVALGHFCLDLQQGLGNDESGKALAKGYTDRANEIFKLMGIGE